MRRPLLKASPAALKRAAEMFRPFDGPRLPLAERQADANQPDLLDPKVERKDDITAQK